ncbi:AAA family ATPase [Parafrankia elaeagni]|uniref:AAA family ATPase n=1 Tax=Parafrankia elaeagni TaxID=222534 RepID=UPI00035F8E56|nr:AAA family ATPase [Parafrankia elaeagni]
MLRNCLVVAVEGTHASGKTTLTHALAAYYRERGVHVACVPEPARNSPFIEEIVVHGRGEFDVECEVDLFAAQLTSLLRTARQHTMVIADKTIANVLAYAWLVLPGGPEGPHAPVLRAMETFCRAWAPVYDAVFYCTDKFDQQQLGDPYRSRVLDIQPAADRVVRSICATVGQRIYDIPPNMPTSARVGWIAEQLTALGLDPTNR